MSHHDGKLWAISDLHCNRPSTWKYLNTMSSFNDDSIIVAGDICDGWSEDRFVSCLNLLKHRFGKVFWTPGNHELYTLNDSKDKYKSLRGEHKYQHLVELCHQCNVITPEDPYVRWRGKRDRPDRAFLSPTSSAANIFKNDKDDVSSDYDEVPLYICPIFTLYDYSFKPDYIQDGESLAWAEESSVQCTDEMTLYNDPFPSREEWCHTRVMKTAVKLDEITADGSHTILASHFSLRYDTVICPYVPSFSIWCGTKLTEDWHLRYNAEAVVFGHTHNRATTMVDNVQFHEVSLGYPNQYQSSNKLSYYLCQILPHRTSIEGCFIV